MSNILKELSDTGNYKFGFGSIQLGSSAEKDTLKNLIKDASSEIGNDTNSLKIANISLKLPTSNLGAFNYSGSSDFALELGFAGSNNQLNFEETDFHLKPITDANYAAIRLGSEFQAAASGDWTGNFWSLSASLATKTGFNYQIFAPFPVKEKRSAALLDLAEQMSLPWKLKSSDLSLNECHLYDSKLNFQLGIEAGITGSADFAALVDSLSPSESLKARVQASLQASLGVGISDYCRLIVAKADTINQDWVRLILSKTDKNSLSIGFVLDLIVEYQLAGGVSAILDHALELKPLAKVKGLIEDLKKLQGQLEPFRNLNPEELEAKLAQLLTDKTFQELSALIPWNQIQSQEELGQALKLIQKIVSQYDSMDERIKSLSGELLSRLELDPSGKLYGALKKIEDFSLETFNAGSTTKILNALFEAVGDSALLEALMGRTTLSLVELTPDQVVRLLEKVKEQASKLFAIANDGDKQLVQLFHKVSKRYGIEGIVEELKKYDSWDELKAKADQKLQKQLSSWIGKALDQISDEDYKRLSQGLEKLLNGTEKVIQAEAKLREWIKKLDGSVQIRLGMQLEFAMEESALLDVEIEPKEFDRAMKDFSTANLGKFIENLLQRVSENGDEALPDKVLLRRGLFSAKKTKTTSSFFNIFSSKRSSSKVLSTSRTVELPSGGASRIATHSGSYLLGYMKADSKSGRFKQFSAGTALEFKALGQGPDLEAAYQGTAAPAFEFTLSLEIKKPHPSESQGVRAFLVRSGISDTKLPKLGAVDELKLNLRARADLGAEAMQAFFSGLEDHDYRTIQAQVALVNWISESLYQGPEEETPPTNEKILKIIGLSSYPDFFKTVANTISVSAYDRVQNRDQINKLSRISDLVTIGVNTNFIKSGAAMLAILPNNLRAYRKETDKTARLGRTLSSHSTPSPKEISEVCQKFPALMQDLDPQAWGNPRFTHWLVLALLQAKILPESTGLPIVGALDLAWTTGGNSAQQTWFIDTLYYA